MTDKSAWHLDKNFSVGMILAILLQCALFIWYASEMNSQVQATKTEVAALQIWKDRQDDDRAKESATLATMTQKLSDEGEALHRIEDILETKLVSKK